MRAASLVGHLALVMLATSALWAQSRDPIRVATRLVQVHVIVQDGDRNPVSGLTREDFRLLDDGKEQVIELFEVESVASTAPPPPSSPGRGYVASPLPPRNAATREAELAAALQNPLESTAMGLTVRLVRAEGAAGSLMVTTRIDPRGVTLQRSGDRWTGQADLLLVQASSGGALNISVDTTLTLNLTEEQRDGVLREGLVVSRPIVLHKNTHQLRVVSRDVPTGATGSLVIPNDKLQAVLAR